MRGIVCSDIQDVWTERSEFYKGEFNLPMAREDGIE